MDAEECDRSMKSLIFNESFLGDLECRICIKKLDGSSKMFPCQHTFHETCVRVIFNINKNLRCPLCMASVDAKIEELPCNILLVRLLEASKLAVIWIFRMDTEERERSRSTKRLILNEAFLDDRLECPVCLEKLDGSSKMLPCQHTFCKRCLHEILNINKNLRCPLCRALVDAKIEELPCNVLLVRLLEAIKNSVQAEKVRVQTDGQKIKDVNSTSNMMEPPRKIRR